MRLARSIGLLTLLGIISCSREEERVSTTTSQFRPGQVWSIHTRLDKSPDASLTVVQVDLDLRAGPVVFVSISGVPRRKTQSAMFFPFSEDALKRSVITLTGENVQLSAKELSDFREYYLTYREGVERGAIGKCFVQTVADVLEADRRQN